MADERLRRKDRLRGSKQFHSHFRQAHRRETSALVFYFKDLDAKGCRFGLTVGRKTGSAVDRNRVKRRLREIFRKRKTSWQGRQDRIDRSFQLVIRPKAEAVRCTYEQLDRQVQGAVERYLASPRRWEKTRRSPRQKNGE